MATDVETRAKTEKKRLDKAIGRLRHYESELKAELDAHGRGDVIADLITYANTGKPGDIPGRLARTRAIKTVLEAIPQAIARFETERNEILRQRNKAANIVRYEAARKAYKKALQDLDARYAKLARSGDGTALIKAADEVARLAGEARMMADLRKYFRVKWKYRPRGADLARY